MSVFVPATVEALTAVVPAVALGLVGTSGWGRTRPVRSGTVESDPLPEVAEIPTSAATFIPAGCGVSVMGAGLVALARTGRGAPIDAIMLVAVGAVVAALGLAERVVILGLDPDGFTIRFGLRRAFVVRWADLTGLSPPRWQLGGWAVRNRSGEMRMLMPSDLAGHEAVLDSIVARARLRYDGREWTT
jgi:hypothetical protein